MTMSAQEARELLSLQPGYAKTELSVAYRRVVRTVHPDLLVGSSEQEVQDASDLLAQVNMANEILQRALRINASESWSAPESAPFAAPSSTGAPFASPTSTAPTFVPPVPPTASLRVRRSSRGRTIAIAVGITVLVIAGFIAVVQLL